MSSIMVQVTKSYLFQVTMSYLEIYNENIRDLLDPSTGYLELRDESRGKNIQVNMQTCLTYRYIRTYSQQKEWTKEVKHLNFCDSNFVGSVFLLKRDPDKFQELANAELDQIN